MIYYNNKINKYFYSEKKLILNIYFFDFKQNIY